MPAPIKITKPVGPGEAPPSLNLRFRGKNQAPFFRFRKIALANFDSDATSLALRLVLDFVKEFEEFPNSNRVRRLQQVMALDSSGEGDSAKSAGKKAVGHGSKK